MLKSELIAELQNVDGDFEVFIYADHGQSYEGVSSLELHRDLDIGLSDEQVDGLAIALYGW